MKNTSNKEKKKFNLSYNNACLLVLYYLVTITGYSRGGHNVQKSLVVLSLETLYISKIEYTYFSCLMWQELYYGCQEVSGVTVTCYYC